ncbi:hypothetical protein P2H44_17495 [Albimonas sp. CAU 1670]|uniref:hypothetical protein n=1 Tax=Albimonas sp. CAU 1670 TaxID=3032599 RepID=UPI0023DB1CF5|nr:hypothetical protein [Albimonas sp. CAU 1670]MDF2234358.1 hypothetical protein [Albimonas sp. CAU 1670]
MPVAVRPARPSDIPAMTGLLARDADRRHACDPALWALAEDVAARIVQALAAALSDAPQPVRQTWLLAEAQGRPVGLTHVLHVPVPPIYLGAEGPPGLVMPEIALAEDAPAGTRAALADAAEAALRADGARILLASQVGDPPCEPAWAEAFAARGHAPLTLYLAKTGLAPAVPDGPRPAEPADIAGLVACSAEHQATLEALDPFWRRHPDADARFEAWMRRSLTLEDRDMRVAGPPEALEGYLVAQPASRLHVPPAHDISRIGVIDDFHHRDFADPGTLADEGQGALALLQAGEAAFAARGVDTAFAVCPAAWRSKADLFAAAGYRTAMVWTIRREPS